MTKKRLLSLAVSCFVLVLAAALVLPACAKAPAPAPTVTVTAPAPAPTPTPAPTPAKVYTLTFAQEPWGIVNPQGRVFRPGGEFQRMLYERTGGHLQLKIVERMFPIFDVLDALMQGKADIAHFPIEYSTGTYPTWAWGRVPGIYNSHDPVEGAFEEVAMYRDPKMLALYDKTFRKIGLVYLGNMTWAGAPEGLYSTKRIDKLADLKGVKVRFYGALNVKAWEALGGTAVSMPASEVPGALMTGAIDATFTSLDYGYSVGWHKITKYFSQFPFATHFPDLILVNAKTFDSLPPDLQQALKEVSEEMERMVALAQSTYVLAITDVIKAGGLEIIKLQDYDKALEIMQAVWRTDWEPTAGADGKSMVEVGKDAIAKYRAFEAFPK
ncbi:MAG: TRAP transporter substrate-binding protein DctP [Chloroflexi bacterium]|nr:TRAP transporter substrate-binding protein DctP [Chloroflexota bacterium]